jgi:predicted PurR-regulated permease PerM
VTSPNQTRTASRFLLALLLLATVLLALVARPIATALFLAAVLAGIVWPAHLWLAARLWGRRSLSAILFVVGVVAVVVGPLVAFSAFALEEGAAGVRLLTDTLHSEGTNGLVRHLPEPLQKLAREALGGRAPGPDPALDPSRAPGRESGPARGQGSAPTNGQASGPAEPPPKAATSPGSQRQALAARLQEQVTARGGKAASLVGSTLSAMGSFVFQAAMMLVALYFLLVEGDDLLRWLDHVSPLRPGQTEELLSEFKRVSFAVVVSTVITSAVQALAALAGYLVFRVPHPVFFAGVTFFVAFIPAIGAGAVCVAAAAVLLVTGHPYSALFLGLWGVLVVGLVDNLIKPFLIKAGMEMQGAVVFFALIGGLGAFGGVGLLIGPLVVSLFLALLRMYERDDPTREPGAPGASTGVKTDPELAG